jgi:imidazole glycerol-phosphate synthase subunit HisH
VNAVVVDLGLGNLGSVMQALKRAGGDPLLSSDPREVAKAPRIVLPGVAAFGLGMERAAKFKSALQDAMAREAPILGICLGMQLLFEEGEEDGVCPGLGFLPGKVVRLPDNVQRPHIGWQKLHARRQSALWPKGWAYFAHSYQCVGPAENVHATVDHGDARIVAAAGRGTLFGVQYHPEKSARDGEQLLRNFLNLPEAS